MAKGVPSKCKVTKEEFLERLFANKGNAFKTYEEMGVPYSVYVKWREDPEFMEQVELSRKKGIEYTENKMFDLIESGNERMIRFLLAAKGGYSEKKTIEVDSRNVIDVQSAIDSIKRELEAD